VHVVLGQIGMDAVEEGLGQFESRVKVVVLLLKLSMLVDRFESEEVLDELLVCGDMVSVEVRLLSLAIT